MHSLHDVTGVNGCTRKLQKTRLRCIIFTINLFLIVMALLQAYSGRQVYNKFILGYSLKKPKNPGLGQVFMIWWKKHENSGVQ